MNIFIYINLFLERNNGAKHCLASRAPVPTAAHYFEIICKTKERTGANNNTFSMDTLIT